MKPRAVVLLVMLGTNPVYDAPADLDFAGAYAKVGLRMHVGLYQDETAALSHWHVPETHFLEAWGDARTFDGTVTIQQPLIEPLSQRELEVLRLFKTELSGPEIARELVIGLSTVRTHTKSIYSKLSVTNRRAAVQRAIELDLI